MDSPPTRHPLSKNAEVAGSALLSAIPLVGSPAAVLLSSTLSASFNRRQAQWFESVAEALNVCEERLGGLTFERLAEDEGFLDTFVAASRAATGTSHQLKLDALKNAVVNSADATSRPVEELRLRMIRLVEEMTPLHIELLSMIDAPRDWFTSHPELPDPDFSVGTQDQLIDMALPALASNPEQRDRLREDLVMWRLSDMGPSKTMMTGSGLLDRSGTTPMGKQFLRYVLSGD